MSLIDAIKDCLAHAAPRSYRPASTMQSGSVKCADCWHFDQPERKNTFWLSNLRRCDATGEMCWKGDDAENCFYFDFCDRRQP